MYRSAKIPRLDKIGYSEFRNLKLLSMSLIGSNYWSAEDIESNQEKKDYEKEKIERLKPGCRDGKSFINP
jgi:hypothetical protein